MKEDAKGFLRPNIDLKKCVQCKKCIMTCPQNNSVIGNTGRVYAALAKDDELREKSSSGGVFSVLARWILRNGGTVFGAAYDNDLVVKHIAIDSERELYRLQGSKYVQSQVGDTYRTAYGLLEEGKWVLYSGTPCQIAGIRAYLKKPYERLLTVDILCHGVPSPNVFKMYVEDLQRRYEKSIADIRFRSKHYGWKNYSTQLVCGEKDIINLSCDAFVTGFLKDIFLRESCYQCIYATTERVGDITLGDYWGYEETEPEHIEDDNRGISLVMANTERGERIMKQNKRYLAFANRTLSDAQRGNPILIGPNRKPEQTQNFWNDYAAEMEWSDLYAKYFPKLDVKKDWLSEEDKAYYAIPYNRRHLRHLIHCWRMNLINKLKGN